MRWGKLWSLLILIIIMGCEESNDPIGGGDEIQIQDLYSGTLTFTKSYALPFYDYPDISIDSVSLFIDDDNYILHHHTNQSELCDTQGKIDINTQTGFVTLDVILKVGDLCDSLRIAKGVFNAQFTDSTIYMDSLRVINEGLDIEDTLFYEFKLKAVSE